MPGKKGDTYSLLIDGYLLPRQEYFEKYGHMDQYDLVETLYRENGPGFTDFIKGNFIIIIACPEVGFYIFTDRIGMKKVFYYFEEKSGEYILSNRFKLVADAVESEPDYTNIAIEVLTHHFIDGLTYLKGIRYSKPASRIRFDGKLNFEHYWDCTELLKLEIEEITPDRLAGEFRGILKYCIDYLKPGKVAVTITGGLDSRTILAALLNIGVKPYTFSYGHPQSPDVVCGRKLAAACDLEYHNHYVQPT
ncbi:MAG: hypothetical protein GY757_25300, partial [bacterium]|nr:hypothetical protein [bacterium]